jgi:hypothetical protein
MGLNGFGGCPNRHSTISEEEDMSPNRTRGLANAASALASAAGLAAFLVGAAAACAAEPSARSPVQLLPLPGIAVRPVPAPLPPPTNPGFAAAPSAGISPLLLQPEPAFLPPQPAAPRYPPLSPLAPIDQQKISSYRLWIEGQQRLLQGGGGTEGYLGREIERQLLQVD